jgi:uncharacterized membrane protein
MTILPIEQIHAIAVHFPIVLLIALALLDISALIGGWSLDGRGCIANLSVSLAIFAGLSGAITWVFGDWSQDIALASNVSAQVAQLVEFHCDLGDAMAVLLVAWALVRGFVWWRRIALTGAWRGLIVLAEIGLVILIIVTAYYCGQLVYEHGVNVHIGGA